MGAHVVAQMGRRELCRLFSNTEEIMNLISIDPGASGGIVFLIGSQVACFKMPATQPDVLELIRKHHVADMTCYIEDPPKYIGQDVPSSTIFVMAENYGYVKGVLQALGIRTIQVTPQKWMKALNLGTKGSLRSPPGASAEEKAKIRQHNAQAKRDWKNKLKAEAQRRFPQLTVTLNTCDALLILDYGKQAEGYREVEQATPFALK